MDAVFNSLLETNLDMTVRPGLAERWYISADGLTYTFYLVKNATWHDGEKFTSSDVKFTFEEILIPLHPQGRVNFGAIESIEIPDDYTVTFKLKTKLPPFILFVSSTFLAPILPKHIYEGTNVLENPANWEPIGTGAFIFKEYFTGDRVVLERNPNYWRKDKPHLDRIITKIIPSEETAIQALIAGEVDYIGWYISTVSVKNLQDMDDPDIVVSHKGTEGLALNEWLYFNLEDPILSNLKVRQAIVYAIDRDKISELAYFGGMSPAGVGPVSFKSEWAFDPNLKPSYPYNPEKAEELLDDANYPRDPNTGIRFSLALNDPVAQQYNVDAEIIKDMLGEVGIDVDHQLIAIGTCNDLLFMRREFQMGFRNFWAGPDPAYTLGATFFESSIGAGSYTNAMGYINPEADAMLIEAQLEMDPAKRREIMLEWQGIIMTDLPGYSIINPKNYIVYRNEWVGVPSNPWGSAIMFAENMWWKEGTISEPEPDNDLEPAPIDEELEARIDTIESTIQSLSSQISSLDSQFDSLESQLDAIEEPAPASETMSYLAIALAVVAIIVAYYFGTQK